MSPNTLLLWIVAPSSGLLVLRGVTHRGLKGWLVVGLVVLLVLGVAWWWRPEVAGYVSAAVWGMLVLLPGMGFRLLHTLISRREYGIALGLARLLSWLHPADGWREQPRLVQVLKLLHEGRSGEAARELEELRHVSSGIGRLAHVLEAQQTGDWGALVAWIDASPFRERLLSEDAQLALGYVRGLGETGRRDAMLRTLEQLSEHGALRIGHTLASIAGMYAAAFCGRVGVVERLVRGGLQGHPADTRAFWLATAEQAAGDPESAAAALNALRDGGNALVAAQAERRLRFPVPVVEAGELSPAALRILEELERDVLHEDRYSVASRSAWRAPATWCVAGVLLAAFACEVPGGATDISNLIEWGALVVPTELTPGEWWRRFTAGLLHFGWLHLGMNVAALLFLGSRLERAWGWWAMLGCYVFATAVSGGLFPLFVEASIANPMVLVGASGGVMGLLGGMLGYLIVGRLRGRSRAVSRELSLLAVIVVLQTTFDLSTPAVSSTCHLLGLGAGVVFGLGAGVLRGDR